MRIIISAVMGLVLTAGAVRAAEPKVVAVSDLPAAVREAADRAIPGINWVVAVEIGQNNYTILGKDRAQRVVEFVCVRDSEGAKGFFRRDATFAEAPAAALMAAQKKLPNFTATEVQVCGSSDGTVTFYRFQGMGYKGGDAGVYVSWDGKTVHVQPSVK